MSVCLCVYILWSHQKSKFHEHLAQGITWTNLKHDEARFLCYFVIFTDSTSIIVTCELDNAKSGMSRHN